MIIDRTKQESAYFELIKKKQAVLANGYYIENNRLFYVSYDVDIIKDITWNKEERYWSETATLEEQIEYYKKLIIEKTREHELLKASGFTGSQEEINLQVEIENLKQMYMDKNHELALQIENRLRKKK